MMNDLKRIILVLAMVAASASSPAQTNDIYAWRTFSGKPGGTGNSDGAGNRARFYYPYGITADGAGNVYVADTYNNTIRKVTSSGLVTTLAGCAGKTGSTDGTGSEARFSSPTSVAVDSDGNVYVADTYNNTIRMVRSDGRGFRRAAFPR